MIPVELLKQATQEGMYPSPYVDRILATLRGDDARAAFLRRYIDNRREDRRQGRRFAAMEAAGWGRRTPR